MPQRIYLLDESTGDVSQCDLSRSGPISALPETLRNRIISAASDKPMLMAWSAASETYIVSLFLQNMVCIFKRIRTMSFNAPFQIVSRAMARLLDPGNDVQIPETQQFVMIPDLRKPTEMTGVSTQDFSWQVPGDMGLFLCCCVPGMPATTDGLAGVITMLSTGHPGDAITGNRNTSAYKLYLVALDLGATNIREQRTQIYRPPFPNIHNNGTLCCGSPAIGFSMLDIEGSFNEALKEWSSRTWNTDLLQENDKKALPLLMRGDPATGTTIPATADWRPLAARISDPLAEHATEGTGGPGAWFFSKYIGAAAARMSRGLAP